MAFDVSLAVPSPRSALRHEATASVDSSGTPSTHRERVTIEGVAFDALREQDVVGVVLQSLAAGLGGNLVTPNVDILRQLRRPELRRLAADAELVVPDGMPIVWASKVMGTELPERVTGSALIWSLSRGAALDGLSVYLLGGAPGIAERAAHNLLVEVPGLDIAGWACPPLGFEKSESELLAIVDGIRDSTPDIVFVGLGFPKQELLMEHLRREFPGIWFVGCGGTLTMVAGEVRRAPVWAQRSGLEWLHRLVMEPRRMARRYLVDDLPFAAGFMVRALLWRTARGSRA